MQMIENLRYKTLIAYNNLSKYGGEISNEKIFTLSRNTHWYYIYNIRCNGYYGGIRKYK